MEETKKRMTAKNASMWSQILMALWIAGWTAFTFLTGASIPMADIILSGSCIAASFSPVYINLILDKIREIKIGGK